MPRRRVMETGFSNLTVPIGQEFFLTPLSYMMDRSIIIHGRLELNS